jgi:hypothetical protein
MHNIAPMMTFLSIAAAFILIIKWTVYGVKDRTEVFIKIYESSRLKRLMKRKPILRRGCIERNQY